MTAEGFNFEDGAGYERYMGKWSQLLAERFLDWLAVESGLRWLDIGCGNGAFTEMIVRRSAPLFVEGVDLSEGQIAHARARLGGVVANFQQGSAMALPFDADAFDAAVMPLVIFFIPDPAKGVSEMARVLRPGSVGSAYAWDIDGNGFPYQTLHEELRAMGVDVPEPPNPAASRLDVLRDLWTAAGFEAVETRQINVERSFESFDEYWATILVGPAVRTKLAAMPADALARLKEHLRAHVPAEASGRITLRGHANAVKGQRQ